MIGALAASTLLLALGGLAYFIWQRQGPGPDDKRTLNSQRHSGPAEKDLEQIATSAKIVTRRAEQIEEAQLTDDEGEALDPSVANREGPVATVVDLTKHGARRHKSCGYGKKSYKKATNYINAIYCDKQYRYQIDLTAVGLPDEITLSGRLAGIAAGAAARG